MDQGLRRFGGHQEMKIILSRKGFDSSSGGVPSPIFPDGRMLSLPIPDKSSTITYKDISGNAMATVGEMVEQLARIPQTHRAHLDPDLGANSFPRSKGWRPIFGQVGAAEGHLKNEGVGRGDVFLFFGLFRCVERVASGWRYIRDCQPIHVLFGWLQVANRVPVSAWPATDRWAHYHPHFAWVPHPSNVIYVSADRLRLPRVRSTGVAGAGLFQFFSPVLRLTAPDSNRPGRWLLPEWFHPEHRASVLSYHSDFSRWQKSDAGVILSSASRGQEFVLDCDHYPEAVGWLGKLLGCAAGV
jgi:hypothetical protein